MSDKQFALVNGGDIVADRKGLPPEDAGHWLPIEDEDSETFDPKRHWRLTPSYRVEAHRVVRVYPVVEKSWEHA